MTFNGPQRELDDDEHLIAVESESEIVYCEDCGTVFVWAEERDCPSCKLAEMVQKVSARDGIPFTVRVDTDVTHDIPPELQDTVKPIDDDSEDELPHDFDPGGPLNNE